MDYYPLTVHGPHYKVQISYAYYLGRPHSPHYPPGYVVKLHLAPFGMCYNNYTSLPVLNHTGQASYQAFTSVFVVF